MNPQLFESALQSGNFWIRYESGFVWILDPDFFLIPWRNKIIEPSSLPWILHSRWQSRSTFLPCSVANIPIWRSPGYQSESGYVPDTCGHGNFWIWKEKVADSKISRYTWTGSQFQIRRSRWIEALRTHLYKVSLGLSAHLFQSEEDLHVYNCVYCFKLKFRHLLAGICEYFTLHVGRGKPCRNESLALLFCGNDVFQTGLFVSPVWLAILSFRSIRFFVKAVTLTRLSRHVSILLPPTTVLFAGRSFGI